MESGGERRAENLPVGILLMVFAVTCFTGLDTTGKWISQSLPPLATVALRYLSSLVFAGVLCRPWRRPGVLRPNNPGMQVLRGLSLVAATGCSFTALHHLPLAQVTAIQFAAPLVIAALAGPLLDEWPGPHRVAAILVGFVGVLVVTRPGFGMHWAVLVAMSGVLANSAYSLTTRHLAGRDRPQTTLFWSAFVGSVVAAPMLPSVGGAPAGLVLAGFVGMGVLATAGHLLLILANERAPASLLATFSYSQLVGAILLGWAVFGDLPDGWTLLGGGIIGASGVYLVLRERPGSG